MADRRFADNLGPALRRRIAHSTIAKRKAALRSKRKKSKLERAKTVLRRTGKQVYAAEIDEGSRAKGFIRIDTRKYTPADVIKMAEQILEREWLRNSELRVTHGIAPKRRERL